MTGNILPGSVSGGDKMGDTPVGDIGFDESGPFKVGRGNSSDILNLSKRDSFYSSELGLKLNLFFCENVDSRDKSKHFLGQVFGIEEHRIVVISECIKYFNNLPDDVVFQDGTFVAVGILQIPSDLQILTEPDFGMVESVEEDEFGRGCEVAKAVIEG